MIAEFLDNSMLDDVCEAVDAKSMQIFDVQGRRLLGIRVRHVSWPLGTEVTEEQTGM